VLDEVGSDVPLLLAIRAAMQAANRAYIEIATNLNQHDYYYRCNKYTLKKTRANDVCLKSNHVKSIESIFTLC